MCYVRNFTFLTFVVVNKLLFTVFCFLFKFRYFQKASTQEILDEIYPKLFPLDTGKICGAFDLLAVFLSPMNGVELWLKNFIDLWNTYQNPSWNVVSIAK